MNRRSFFRLLGAGAATVALTEAIPFGRVWSFPSKIVVPKRAEAVAVLTDDDLWRIYLQPAAYQLANEIDLRIRQDAQFGQPFPVGTRVPIRIPPRFKTIELVQTAGIDFDLVPA